MSTRIYDPAQLERISKLFTGLNKLIEKFEPGALDDPLYIESMDVIIRHRDDYTVARFGSDDDYLFLEFTDEDYGAETPLPDVATAIARHVRQEDTASGQKP